MKKKLKDLTISELIKELEKCDNRNCNECPFEKIQCGYGDINEFEFEKLNLENEIEVEE